MFLSVVVCTHNRCELVCECIESLLQQTVNKELYEIIVVDNASTDDTAQHVKHIFTENSTVKYIYEEQIGLSQARNTGFRAARFDWIAYIDDDALAHRDYVEQILWTIENYDWDCFGGVFNRWFKYGQPKWYPEHFGTNKFDFDRIDLLPNHKYACGGIWIVRKAVLERLKGFDISYGMKGGKIGYGEETELQQRMRAKGYKIGFNPNIQMDHLVAKYKLSVWWHLKAAWQNEKATTLVDLENINMPFWLEIKRILVAGIKRLKYIKHLRQKDYYWQNFLFDYSEPIIRKISALYFLYLKRKNV